MPMILQSPELKPVDFPDYTRRLREACRESPELKYNPIPKMLADARDHLLWCRARLANARRLQSIRNELNYEFVVKTVEADFLAALDRVHDVQSMTIASF
jgi:hypothetical protein